MFYVDRARDNAACRESPAESRESGSASEIRRNGRRSLASVSEETKCSEGWEIAATKEEIVSALTHGLRW
jgi:hypothetical protein